MFRFQHKYPQKFLDELAEAMGIEWIPVIAGTVPRDTVKVQALPPPSGNLYYIEVKYKD
jgi:hypothetical protein